MIAALEDMGRVKEGWSYKSKIGEGEARPRGIIFVGGNSHISM